MFLLQINQNKQYNIDIFVQIRYSFRIVLTVAEGKYILSKPSANYLHNEVIFLFLREAFPSNEAH